jgi:hypothetical protein
MVRRRSGIGQVEYLLAAVLAALLPVASSL